MFKFGVAQKVYEIGGVKVGGEVGENPTVMIGSIFYRGHKIVEDDDKGIFDRQKAEELISKAEEISDRTGLPSMLDVVCAKPSTTEKYLEFAADTTQMPLLIDAVSQDAALRGLDCAKELQITERTIINSLNPETKEPIYQKIRGVGLESAILLTYSAKAVISSKERLKLLDTLVPKAKEAGIKNMLIDTVVLDLLTLGLACKAIFNVKDQFGYPAGCGAHNAIESWRGLKDKKDKQLILACSSVVNGLPIAIGADFVLYGPVDAATYMFPTIAVIDACYGQLLMELGKRPSPEHPRVKIAHL